MFDDHVRRESGDSVVDIALDDPARPAFERLPRADLDDGRPLRRAAFEVWARHVRREMDVRGAYETRFRPAQPAAVAASLAGGGLLATAIGWVLLGWTLAEAPRGSRVEPGMWESAAIVLGLLLAIAALAQVLLTMARTWLCRGGSFVHLDRRGIRWLKGTPVQPFDVVRAARHHPWLRCASLDLVTGERLWIPAERGPLVRLDLVLAALHPPLRPDDPTWP